MVCGEDTRNYPGVKVGATSNTLPVSIVFTAWCVLCTFERGFLKATFILKEKQRTYFASGPSCSSNHMPMEIPSTKASPH